MTDGAGMVAHRITSYVFSATAVHIDLKSTCDRDFLQAESQLGRTFDEVVKKPY